MIEELKKRFGADSITSFKVVNDGLELLLIRINQTSPITLLMTNGLSNYKMPVHEKFKGREHNELYFCLPSYWDITEENVNRNWPVNWLEKLVKHVLDKKAWYGPGHTFQTDEVDEPLSDTIKQGHLMMVSPILLEEELKPIEKDGKQIHFLGIMPIYFDELEYKQAKGTTKLVDKFVFKHISEKLDDYRETILRSRWKLFKIG
jgi:hypothetical protein